MAAPKRSNNLLILIGAIFLVVGAGLVVVLLRADGNSGASAGPTSGSDTVPVVVSKRAIPKGALGKDLADAVEIKQVPAVTRPSDALVTLAELTDRRATVDIGAGQPLRAAFFRETTARGSLIQIPEGKQAIAVTVPFIPAVAGYVGQGDTVNVYATISTRGDVVVPKCAKLCDSPTGPNAITAGTRLVLSNVLVLDISQEVAPSAAGDTTATTVGAGRAAGPPTITYLMALDASQAERMVFFTTYADLYLSLVPKDQPPSATQGRDQSTALRP